MMYPETTIQETVSKAVRSVFIGSLWLCSRVTVADVWSGNGEKRAHMFCHQRHLFLWSGFEERMLLLRSLHEGECRRFYVP